jgi:integrase
MGTKKLTDKTVENATAMAGARVELWDAVIGDDASLPGAFGLRVTETGAKSWQIMYRVTGPDGRTRQRRMVLGTYPSYGLAEARDNARDALKMVGRGIDPAEARSASQQAVATIPTVRTAVAEFIEKYARQKNRSWRETERIFDRYVVSRWGDRLLPSIKRADVVAMLDEIADGGAPYMANRTLATIRKFWNWCLEKGKTESSPVAHVKAPGREVSRDRVLADVEITAIWSACESMGWPFGPVVRMLLITGQRLQEVAGAKWADIDLARNVWTLPREQTKSDRLHEVPLSPLALEMLRDIPRVGGDFVFSTTGRSPVSGFSKAKARVDNLILDVRRKTMTDSGVNPATVTGPLSWRLHDLRRTVASGMARLRIEPWVVEKVLNHASGQLSGVAGVYNRWGYADEKRNALDTWARHLDALIRPVANNIIQIGNAREAIGGSR